MEDILATNNGGKGFFVGDKVRYNGTIGLRRWDTVKEVMESNLGKWGYSFTRPLIGCVVNYKDVIQRKVVWPGFFFASIVEPR